MSNTQSSSANVTPLTNDERDKLGMLVAVFGAAHTARRLERPRASVVAALAGAPMRAGTIALVRLALHRTFDVLSGEEIAVLTALAKTANARQVASDRTAREDDEP